MQMFFVGKNIPRFWAVLFNIVGIFSISNHGNLIVLDRVALPL